MIRGLKPYLAYKDSGLQSLGKVPEHWELRRLSQIGKLFKGNGGSKEDEASTGVPCVRYGDLYTTHTYFIEKTRSFVASEQATNYTLTSTGDVLFAASGETIEEIGKSAVNLIPGEVRCGGDIILFRPALQMLPRYMGYVTDCRPVAAHKASMGRGITVKHIYADQLKRLLIPLPPLTEQSAIVRFLDHADRRIRRYIRAKKKLIALLNEQKQAIIHQAVTRGLDPNVRLKPSGVEWLGEMPEHWELQRVKQAARILRGKFTHRPRNDPSLYDGPYPFIQTGEVARATKSIASYRQTLNERGLSISKMFPQGTLVMTIAANIGDVAVLDFDACFPDSIVGFVPRKHIERDYLYYLFRAMKLEFLHEAPVNTQGNLNVDRVGARRIPIPPLKEQKVIISGIERNTANLDYSAKRALDEIGLLSEFRSRLIADVVTGQLDVREAAARLPEKAKEPEPLDEVEATEDDAAGESMELDSLLEEAET